MVKMLQLAFILVGADVLQQYIAHVPRLKHRIPTSPHHVRDTDCNASAKESHDRTTLYARTKTA